MLVWIFGIGAMISLFLSYQSKSRHGILIGKLCADLCWSAHYLSLGAFAGMIPNSVGIFRELIFINRKKYCFANKTIWPILFIALNMTLGILSFSHWFDLLPIVASAFVTVSLWIERPRLTKIISIPVSTAFLIYNLLVGSYIGVINESIAILSILLFFIQGFIQERKRNESNNLHQ